MGKKICPVCKKEVGILGYRWDNLRLSLLKVDRQIWALHPEWHIDDARFHRESCFLPLYRRLKLELKGKPVAPVASPSTWVCRFCDSVNPQDQFKCVTCGAARKERGKTGQATDR
jgi:hypothetical protein